jgi:hypothetical protein
MFWLVMCEAKLGHRAEARRVFNQAVARMESTWPKNPQLVLMRARASEALALREH